MAFTIPGFSVGIGGDATEFLRALFGIERASKETANTVSRAFGLASTALKGLAAGLGVTLSVGALVQFGRAALNTADQLLDLSRQTGVSVEALQAFQRMATLSGSSAEQMTSGLLNMTRGIGQLQDGTGRLASQLEKLDPELAKQLRTVQSQEEALNLVAESIQRAGSEFEQQAIAVAVFGDAGRQLAVSFSEGAEGIAKAREESRRMGEISTEAAEAAARANDEFDKLATIVSTNLAQAFLAAAPQIEGLAYLMSQMALSTRNFFEELNARGTTALNFQIGELNEQLAKLQAQQESMPGFLSWVNQNEINQLRAARDELIRQRDAMEDVSAAGETVAPKLKPVVGILGDIGDGAGNAAGKMKDFTETLTFDPEADLKLKQFQSMAANQKRIEDERVRTSRQTNERIDEDFTRQQSELAAEIQGIYESPAIEFADQEATVALLSAILEDKP